MTVADLLPPSSRRPDKRRSSLPGGLLRLAVGLAIIGWLIVRMDVGDLFDALSTGVGNWPWLGAGCVMLLVALCACGLRWKMLLEAQQIKIPLRNVVHIFFVGQFFNLFLMGATGGDLIKACLVARTAGDRKTEAVSSVLIDRMIGLMVLTLLAGAMVAWRPHLFFGDPALRPIGVFILAFMALMLVVVVVPLSRHWLQHPWFSGLGFLPHSAKRIEQISRRVYEACFLCRRNPRLLAQTFLLSLANHLLAVTACIAFGKALQIPLAWVDYLTYVPVIGVFGALPITPGGLGLREGAAVVLLGSVGIARPQAMLLSLLLYAGLTSWSLFGGLLFVLWRPPDTDASDTDPTEIAGLTKSGFRDNLDKCHKCHP